MRAKVIGEMTPLCLGKECDGHEAVSEDLCEILLKQKLLCEIVKENESISRLQQKGLHLPYSSYISAYAYTSPLPFGVSPLPMISVKDTSNGSARVLLQIYALFPYHA